MQTPAQTTEVVTPTPTPAQPPKNGLYKNGGKTYYNKNGKLVKNKYGYKIKRSITASTKKVLLHPPSTAEDWLVHALKNVWGRP